MTKQRKQIKIWNHTLKPPHAREKDVDCALANALKASYPELRKRYSIEKKEKKKEIINTHGRTLRSFSVFVLFIFICIHIYIF